jgi:predicted dehydrogenase
MHQLDRRAFLKSTGGLLALAALDLVNLRCASTPHQDAWGGGVRSPKGPNERINVAVIGLGGRSAAHLSAFGVKNNCRITWVCDPDTDRAKAAIDRARTSNGGADPRFERDLRRVFDDRSVDIVTIAACNHWHSLAGVWAMLAGKDVYVEKPLSHNLNEGRTVVEVAARTGRVCQHGTQMRSNPGIREAIAWLHGGALGPIRVSRGLCYKPRPSIGKVSGAQPPPATVDYDLWCGPAPLNRVRREKFHYDWHWFWSTGNGDIGNQGVHEIDLARWALGIADSMPRSVVSVGGRFGYDDDGQTPNTQVAAFDYGPATPRLVMEVRGLKTSPYELLGVENVVECEQGYLVFPTYTTAIAYDRDANMVTWFEGEADAEHFGNFLAAVRSRRVQDLTAPAIEGHRSCALLHMANISYRLGESVPLDEAGRMLADDDAAQNAVERMTRHLLDNGVNPASATYDCGRRLNFDAVSETFVNDDEANRLRTRVYRAPYIMPSV